MKMMKWMLIGCLAILVLIFILPYLGIEGLGAYSGWLFFGLIFLVCVLPMVWMNRRNDNK